MVQKECTTATEEISDVRTFDNEQALTFITEELLWGGAAGACKDGKLARRYAEAGMRVVPYGSIAAQQRPGNPGDNFWFDEKTGDGINALGVPCKPFEEHLDELPDTRKDVEKLGGQVWASVTAGDKFVSQEYHDMAYDIGKKGGADVAEGNFSCGNIKIGDVYKPIVCYDLDLFDDGVEALCAGAKSQGMKTAVKLTPTTERRFLMGNVHSCLKHGVDYIVMANTIPNSYLEKPDGTPAISMVRGGLSGRSLIPIVTGMIQMTLPEIKGTKTKIIAAGGVQSGRVAYHYLKHGAHGFVFGTLLWANNFNPRVAQDVIYGSHSGDAHTPGLIDFLVEHGLPS